MQEEKKKGSVIRFIVTIVVITGAVLLFVNRNKLNDDKHYTIFFNDVEGLTVASQVSINGAVVGKVSAAELLSPEIVKVTISIGKEIKIPTGTTAKLSSAGMSGGEEIRLILAKSKETLADNGIINGINSKKPFSKDGKIRTAMRLGKIGLRTTDSIITDISGLFDAAAKQDIRFQLNKLDNKSSSASKTANQIKGNGDKLINKIRETEKSVAQLADKSNEWPKMMADGEKKTEELVQTTAGIEERLKTLQTSLKKFKSISDQAKDEKTALGKLLNDKQQYHTTNRNTDTLNRSLKEVMRHPSAHWFAIFGHNR